MGFGRVEKVQAITKSSVVNTRARDIPDNHP